MFGFPNIIYRLFRSVNPLPGQFGHCHNIVTFGRVLLSHKLSQKLAFIDMGGPLTFWLKSAQNCIVLLKNVKGGWLTKV